ncbi:hypothetical protein DRN97_02195 [Methanosarcinales archaeon]|nr:MAG: hypothetical protein DRN97_02195 [Methanosarcinales archaeon]
MEPENDMLLETIFRKIVSQPVSIMDIFMNKLYHALIEILYEDRQPKEILMSPDIWADFGGPEKLLGIKVRRIYVGQTYLGVRYR